MALEVGEWTGRKGGGDSRAGEGGNCGNTPLGCSCGSVYLSVLVQGGRGAGFLVDLALHTRGSFAVSVVGGAILHFARSVYGREAEERTALEVVAPTNRSEPVCGPRL